MGLLKIGLYIVCALLAVSQFGRIFTSSTHMIQQNILLVTAHPDDETMFFGPTLRHVLDPAKDNNVHVLVLSRGDSEGLGVQREREMRSAASYLKIPPGNVQVINDPRLLDSMDTTWDSEVVKDFVASTMEETGTNTVITFDSNGVSGHINHKYVFEGTLKAAVERAAASSDFSMLTLFSVPLWRKYLFSVDGVFSRIITIPEVHYSIIGGQMDYHHVRTALYKHESQITWYRRLWSYFSRYMVVNDLGEVNIGKALQSEIFKEQMKDPNFKKVAQKIEKPIGTEGTNIQTSAIKPKPTKDRAITRSKPNFSSTALESAETDTPSESKKPSVENLVHSEL